MIDLWSSAGNDIPRQMQNQNRCLLPMDEVQFDVLSPDTSPAPALRPGLWGRMVQLAAIFSGIQDLHKQHVNHNITDAAAEEITRGLANDLDQFAEDLPASVRLTESNAQWHADRRLGSAYVALHLGYLHYSTLLYFQYLDLQQEQTPAVVFFASKCRTYAAAFSDLLRLSKRIKGCEAVYFIVAHMTVVSSATLLHTLLFGHDSELPQTRDRLKQNFETLVELRNYWPAVGQLVSYSSWSSGG